MSIQKLPDLMHNVNLPLSLAATDPVSAMWYRIFYYFQQTKTARKYEEQM